METQARSARLIEQCAANLIGAKTCECLRNSGAAILHDHIKQELTVWLMAVSVVLNDGTLS